MIDEMRDWHNDGGFSLDAAVRIPGWHRAGLARLLRYCARPPTVEDAPLEVDPDDDPIAQPEPEVEFDQRVQW